MYNYLLTLSLMLFFCTGAGLTIRASQAQSSRISDYWMNFVGFQTIKRCRFMMDSPDGEKNRDSNEGQVLVEISKSFDIMEKELTQKQWFLVKRKNPSHFKRSEDCDDHEVIEGVEMCPNHPVENVSWDDIQDYIRELNASMKLTGCNGTPKDASGCYRLPTEAEWECAVRDGMSTAYFFGDDSSSLGDYAWYNINSGGRTHEVGTKATSSNGFLYDVYGNVWEWVQDSYSSQLPGGIDPLNDSGSLRVIRGGSWVDNVWNLRSPIRSSDYPNNDYNDLGFRLVRTLL